MRLDWILLQENMIKGLWFNKVGTLEQFLSTNYYKD